MSSNEAAPTTTPTPREVARVRVIFGDTDQMGMVYYATYLRYFEIARNEYLRKAGAPYRAFEETHGLRLPVVEAHARYHAFARYDDEVMVEQFVGGVELTVGILGDEALPVIEIRPQHEMFDYECKYQPGMAEEICPAPIDPALAARTQDAALRAHRALKLAGYSRIDFRVSAGGDLCFLEANTAPGMTANSLIPKAARVAGLGFPAFAERVCQLARARRGTNR